MPPSNQESCRKRRHVTTAVLATAPLVASTIQKPEFAPLQPGPGMAQAACSNPKHRGNCHKQTAMRALYSP
jgi:hypothetical protein